MTVALELYRSVPKYLAARAIGTKIPGMIAGPVALATALDGAAALDSFLAVTRAPLVKASECLLVAALATHMTLGLRVLAIELFAVRERTVAVLTVCAAAVFAVGAAFLLNVG